MTEHSSENSEGMLIVDDTPANIECLPSATPVCFNRDNQQSFFVPISNTTQVLKPSEVMAYMNQYFSATDQT